MVGNDWRKLGERMPAVRVGASLISDGAFGTFSMREKLLESHKVSFPLVN